MASRSLLLGLGRAGAQCSLAGRRLRLPRGRKLRHTLPLRKSPVATQHSNPLNFDPVVREGFERFYILDFDGALSRFESILKAHPDEPIAYGYVQMATVFRELYHQDLLDTTYYAHDSLPELEAECARGGRYAAED